MLSLLLLSFAFLVVHDFVMPAFESTFESSYSHQTTLQEQQMHDISEDIHETIHTIVAADVFVLYSFLQQPLTLNPLYRVTLNDSNNLSVLERPPL